MIRCTKQKDVDPFSYQSKINYRYKNTEALSQRLNSLKKARMDALSKDAELSVKVPKLIVNEGVRVARDEGQKVKEIKKNQLNTFDKKTPMG